MPSLEGICTSAWHGLKTRHEQVQELLIMRDLAWREKERAERRDGRSSIVAKHERFRL